MARPLAAGITRISFQGPRVLLEWTRPGQRPPLPPDAQREHGVLI